MEPLSMPDIATAVSNPLDVFDKALGAIMKGDPLGLEALLRCAEVCTYIPCNQFAAQGKQSSLTGSPN
jgi:hypothetical protein